MELRHRLAKVGPCGAGGKLVLLRRILADLPAEVAARGAGGAGGGAAFNS